MSSGFKDAITIWDAVEEIQSNKLLLPAIQRKFVWKHEQIEALFDSVMRGYPVNSFMFWRIKDNAVKNSLKFYRFLENYREKYREDNDDMDVSGLADFDAVIDGQQRLTSLLVGLKGTYAYHSPRKAYKDDEHCFPTRRLYLNLASYAPEGNEDNMRYDFRFLTEKERKSDTEEWFEVRKIIELKDDSVFRKFAKNLNDVSFNILSTLHQRIFKDPIINYYLEGVQDLDIVLDIFIRTNSGGTRLSFSDLLMSYVTANWKERDAREDFRRLIEQVRNEDFFINGDFILKTCLVLFKNNIKFQAKNFDCEVVREFEENWGKVSSSILSAFIAAKSWGFNENNFKAKYTLIPVIYYIYKRGIQCDITNPNKHREEKEDMRKWLGMAILKEGFGKDSQLESVRKVINESPSKSFPLTDIINEAKGSNVNLSFDGDTLDNILKIQYGDPKCYAVLSLLYSHFRYISESYHIDHIHPKVVFENLERGDVADGDYEFFANKENWNSIANLQLLLPVLNESKKDKSLVEWVEKEKVDLAHQILPTDVSLDFKEFRAFVEKRREMLKERLREITSVGE